MNEQVADRLSLPDPLIAIVGATDTPSKYGGIIYRDLKAKGFRVVGVNPNRSTVDGDDVYARLSDLPENPDIVNIVVPPNETLGIVDEAAALPNPAVWVQPGAGDAAVRARLQELEIPALVGPCIMVEARRTA
ncbi:MAG: CoA-binding protein [Acidimicrobiia bacterium]